ncbi:MAG: hypothetical protein GY847_17780 [Proteobacteria bacterium]|nr:hypothetical protein [Pseudomonadota bacterium]
MHHLARTGETARERSAHPTFDIRLAALDLNALANGETWVDNGAALHLDGAFTTASALMTSRLS